MKRNLLFILVALLPLVASADEYTDPLTNVIYTYNPASNRAEVKSGTWLMFDNGEASLPTPGSPDAKDEIGILDRFSVEGKEYVVDKIGDYAFSTLDIKSVVIPSSVKSIGMDAFSGCALLSDLFLSEGLISIEDNAFCGCHSLTYLLFPEGLETIGFESFTLCSKLKSVSIPSSVTNIDVYAFFYCSSLTDVYCYGENVPETGIDVFKDCPIASATLHVPAGSVEKYKAAEPWNGFGNIVAIEEPHQPLPFLEGNPIWEYKYEHISMPRDPNLKCWVDTGDRSFTYYFLGGKKEIEGRSYTMMGEVRCDRDGKITLSRWLPVREENGIVYAITDSLPGVVETEDNYDARYNDDNPMPYLRQGNECVLYNFSTNIGETLYPQNEGSTVKSIDTYQLLDGTECRVLKTQWAFYDLYEKLGLLNSDPDFGIMDPFIGWPVPLNGHIYLNILNAYYQDNIMLYKAPDARDGLCVNDTCWTRDDAEAYARSYKADPYQEKAFSFIRQLQMATAITFTKGQMATIILPTAPDAGKGKYYRLDRCEDGKIIFEQEKQPQDHIPYIIVPSEDFSIDTSTLDLAGLRPDTVSIAGISFIGSYKSEELKEKEGWYIDIIDTTPDCQAEEGKAYTIGALRAYLTVNWDDPINHSGSKGPGDKLEIVLKDNGTGLTPPLSKGEGDVYDLSGRQINAVANSSFFTLHSSLKKGIYIMDGKKIIQ